MSVWRDLEYLRGHNWVYPWGHLPRALMEERKPILNVGENHSRGFGTGVNKRETMSWVSISCHFSGYTEWTQYEPLPQSHFYAFSPTPFLKLLSSNILLQQWEKKAVQQIQKTQAIFIHCYSTSSCYNELGTSNSNPFILTYVGRVGLGSVGRPWFSIKFCKLITAALAWGHPFDS